ncbi:MAG: T9SS type A sorting domain-containing protein [Bacteroidetes bacterium]|nr:T9SS type A sorting domain-containing protein [Bacteroidota bacterium]
MRSTILLIFFLTLSLFSMAQPPYQYAWKYYTTGNTGILGDYSEALWIDHDGDPYLAAYTPGWEEGGFSKFIQTGNHWVNYSNVEYPVIGSTADVGSSRISDIAEDSNGNLWMAAWRGILKFDPSVGGSSLMCWGANNSIHPGGRTMDIDIAPDGSVWAAVQSVTWGGGGLVHYNPATNAWQYWGYGITANNWPGLIGFCEQVSIQAKPAGGYKVWIDGEGWNTMITFDSDTQLFTLLPQNLVSGEVVALPGNDCTDGEGNLWALRYTSGGNAFSLDYRKPDGTWVSPAQPSSVIADIWAFKAFGNHEALITGLNSEVFQFDGTSWQSKGIWRDGAYTYSLDIDAAGNIWACGVGGAARRDVTTGNWQRHRITNSSQIDYFVDDMSIDNEGNVWMTGNAGPGVGGFQKFDGTTWTGFNEQNYGLGYPFPFPTDNSEAICYRPSNGTVVINPMFNNLHSWNGTSYTSLNYNSSKSKGLVEDSQGRLWSYGENSELSYYSDANQTWTSQPFFGTGEGIKKDPTRPGTIWASSGSEVRRTDGAYNYSKVVGDFQELDPQSDVLTTVIPAPDGIAWVGSNKGLFKLDANSDTYQFFSPSDSGIPGENVTPLAYSPDGRLWFTNFMSVDTTRIGLCWYDGTQFGVFPVEAGGLPHAQIPDIEVKDVPNGYELWMSCLSRGIAVLNVTTNPVGVARPPSPESIFSVMNYPNPLTTRTSVGFSLVNDAFIVITVYDMKGNIVRNMASASFKPGKSTVEWDGCDNQGEKVIPGIYTIQLKEGNYSKSILVILQ